jgi:FkbM family methyltransferase
VSIHPDCGSIGLPAVKIDLQSGTRRNENCMKVKIMKKVILSVLLLAISGLIYHQNSYFIKDWIIKSPFIDFYLKYFRDGPDVDADHLITTLDHGEKIIVNKHDKTVCRFTRITGHWDSNETKVIEKLVKPGFRIIEVGGNFGVHTIRMGSLVGPSGKVFSFEANPNVSKYLQQSVALNKFEDRISIFPMALSNETYEGSMVYNLSNIGAGYITPKNTNTLELYQKTLCAPIHVRKLDDILEENSIDPLSIDLLKMDAEGSEFWILQGSSSLMNNKNLLLMMEYDTNHLARNKIIPNDFISFLKNAGFSKVYLVHSGGVLQEKSWDDLLKPIMADIILTKGSSL